MLHNYGKPASQEERTAAIHVACWLNVALPQDLADALDRYAAALGPEITPAEAVRRVLREVLLGGEPSRLPAV
jgi:hypothetical protein